MKKTIFIFLLLSNIVLGQNNTSIIESTASFNSLDGYLIYNPYSAVYDEDGFLWIIGENKTTNEFVIGKRKYVIQRFDGANFYTLELPLKIENRLYEAKFFGDKKGGLYLNLFYENIPETKLYFIDTKNLTFTYVKEYETKIKPFLSDVFYHFKGKTRIVATTPKKIYSAEIDGLHVKFLDSLPVSKSNFSSSITHIAVADSFVIPTFSNLKSCIIDSKGDIKKMLTEKDFEKADGTNFYPNYFFEVFKNDNRTYFAYRHSKDLLQYKNGVFKEVKNTKPVNDSRKIIYWGNKNNTTLYIERESSNYTLSIYKIIEDKHKLIDTIKIDNFSEGISNDYEREFVVLYENKLIKYFFQNSAIKTFVKDKSIRGIRQLKKDTYLVATEMKGFYEINTKDNTEKHIILKKDGVDYPIRYSRDIYKNGSTFITNDQDNFYEFDKNYNIFYHKNLNYDGEENIKIGDTIFKAGRYGVLMKYNIKDKSFTIIKGTEEYIVKEFATDGKKLFATSTKGILEYYNGKFSNFVPKEEKGEDLLSIKYIKEYGLFVSTRFGKLYQYNPTEKTFKLFYEDNLKASIVGLEIDNYNNFWLNTYAGIVSYNPTTKKATRYGKKDGVYELEGNRYSTYKDAQGNMLIGSFKGLSFFNPQTLKQQNLELTTVFTAVSFFNAKENKWVTREEPNFLKEVKEINLPASNQRFSSKVAVLGTINNLELKFRYRLFSASEDTKPSWNRLTNGNEILFTHLASGIYQFEVEALTASNQKIGKTLQLQINSKEIFYKTWWFMVLVILASLFLIGYFFYQFKTKQQLYAETEIALNEARVKEAMMLEIHHRIKNNLQIVSGLLSLQAMKSDNKELKEKLQDSQSRIESIAGIHNVLYNADNQESIVVKDYFANIVNYNKNLFPVKVEYSMDIDESILFMDKAIPLALTINELISNSYKHAFANVENPEISITFYKEKNKCYLHYADNGVFKEKDTKRASMGLRIIDMMNNQLKGNLTVNSDKNFSLNLEFKDHE